MAVRHRTATVEAVQYHPESCMSEGGRGMMANFLRIKGGSWGGENAWCGVPSPGETKLPTTNGGPSLPTILNQIHTQRIQDVEIAKPTLATTQENLSISLSLHTAPPLIDLVDRINSTPHTAVMAEIKRASPSKGDIAPDASAPAQALRYAMAGASVISVLTEPKWFKGSLTDMHAVRQAIDSLPNRPAVLRKDFILSTYQIDEARLYGADTVLLIVAMLEPKLLRQLYTYSVGLGMEPLVEVNNPEELEIALGLGAKVIGVNNRNLHDFKVDMTTTSRVNAALSEHKGKVILCALSGISSPEDVEKYVKEGVRAVLVGESLMRAKDAGAFLRSLIGVSASAPSGNRKTKSKPLVKICGIRSVADATIAIEAGADLLGIILVPGTKRFVPSSTAREISDLVRATRQARRAPLSDSSSSSSSSSSSQGPTPHAEQNGQSGQSPSQPQTETNLPWFTHHSNRLFTRPKPLLVGVFQNQPLPYILDLIDEIGFDIVQLHGDEPQSLARFIPVPVIKCFRITSEGKVNGGEVGRPGCNQFILLDSAKGGSGETFPWERARELVARGEAGGGEGGGGWKLPIFLAGGLNPDNVRQALEEVGEGVVMVDVSSGVEYDDGVESGKSREKVEGFVRAVKG